MPSCLPKAPPRTRAKTGRRGSTRVCTLLAGFGSDEARARAEELLAHCARRELAAGASLTPTSLPNGAFILVEDGFVVVRTAGASGRRVVSCYGATGTLLPPLARGETLVALVGSLVTVVPESIRRQLLEVPEGAQIVVDLIESTLRQKSATILALADIRHTDRVRRKLMQLAGDHGRVAPDGVHVQFPLTRELLAEMVGSARETVTRALDVLEREDFVRRDGRSYRLLVAPETLVP